MTPSRMRREGRRAFIPGESPGDNFPFRQGWTDFLHGWDQAEKAYEAEEKEAKERAEENRGFTEVRQKIEDLTGRKCNSDVLSVLDDIVDLIEEIKNSI